MAGYVTLPTHRTVQVISATTVLDVMELPFITSPSGVTAQVYAPYVSWLATGADAFIAPVATAIEDLISGGLATGGTFTTTVDVPITALGADTGFGAVVASLDPAQLLRNAYDQLVATAGL